MRVELLGEIAVRGEADRAVTGAALGGRRARVALAALALADGPVPADRLAAAIWGDEVPPTWQPALRGIVRSLRIALDPLGGGEQRFVVTAPSGYRLAAGVEVDVRQVAADAGRAAALLAEGRHRAALELATAPSQARGAALLPDDGADWLVPHRAVVDAAAAEAGDVVAAAASALGEHAIAIAAARRAVAERPLDERAHRTLIRVLDAAGDRAAAVQAYESCRATLADQLGIDPSAETAAAYLAAIADQGGSTLARIPTSSTSFLGREPELTAVLAGLARPGLVTVVGRGGVGKSRLAMQAAVRAEFAGGRSWVSLGAVAEDSLVAATAALALGVPVGGEDAEAALSRRLAPLGRSLLVLDGCDVVVDGTASLVAALVAACPALTVLVTSRVALAVDAELLVDVEPFPVPDPGDAAGLRANMQVRLLLDRARDGGATFEVDAENADLVAALCRQCDGLPLALELVAAQLSAMPVGDLLDQLGELDLGRDDRLRAIARSSYDLLDADEATVFRRFAVLEGPVGLPLIRAVVAGADVPPVRVIRILRELTARGLIAVDRTGARWRYQQDDDLHRFAGELLAAAGEELATFDRLADGLIALLPEDPRVAPAPYADEITAVLGSVRALFAAAIEGRADPVRTLELGFRLHRYWAATTVAEGRFWLRRLLAVGSATRWTRYATYALGYLSYWSGDADALDELRAAVAMFEDEPDPYLVRAHIYVAGLLDDLDRPAESLDFVRRSIALAEPFGTDLYVAAAMGMGSVLSERGDVSAATYAADAVARCRVDGSAEQMAALLPTAAAVCWQVGALDAARAFAAEARPMHVGTKRIARVVLLSTSAGLALAEGDVAGAVEYGTIADTEATELGVEREMPLVRAILARALLAHGDRAAAISRARSAVEVAAAMTVGFPLASALEVAALVVDDVAAPPDLAALLAAAATIRTAGDRPAPATLRADVAALRDRVGAVVDPGRDAALALARRLLGVQIDGQVGGQVVG